MTLLNFFEIGMDMHFVSLFFLKERNMTASIWMIHLKCTAMHYINLIEAPKQALLKLRVAEYAISFFLCLIYVYFNAVFAKIFMK